jgi:hypothetical protein
MAYWQPHGLIQKRALEAPYRDAKLAIDAYGNSQDPKEHFTVKLFEDLFNKQIFAGDDFFVNSQKPPSTKRGTDKACDIVIMYVDGAYEHQILCFAECKRAKNVTTSKIRALETQAQGYCQDFLDAHPDNSLAYACTLVGVFIRCWSLRRGDRKLQGFWAGNEKDHFEHYRDVGLDEHRRDIEMAFDQMKSVPPLGLRLGQDHSAIGSSSYGTFAQAPEMEYNVADQFRFDAPPIPSQPMEVEPNDSLVDVAQLLDQNYVSVSIREYGESISENLYRFIHNDAALEKRGHEWHEETVLREGQPVSCMVYTGRNSGIRYWTWTLDPESDAVGVDLKHKAHGKKRR